MFADHCNGRWIIDQLLPIARADCFAIVAYCVMPDHVHLVVEGESEASDLRLLVHRWKLTTSYRWKTCCGGRLWQEGYFDCVLRPEDDLGAVIRYVLNNPVRAGLVARVEDYSLVGSDRYPVASLVEAAGDWHPRRRSDR